MTENAELKQQLQSSERKATAYTTIEGMKESRVSRGDRQERAAADSSDETTGKKPLMEPGFPSLCTLTIS